MTRVESDMSDFSALEASVQSQKHFGVDAGAGAVTADSVATYDVVIFGAGIVGCVTALLLRQHLPHLKIAVVDPDFSVPAVAHQGVSARYASSHLWEAAWRVSAVSLSVRAILQSLGLWGAVLAQGVCPYHDMVVADADGTGRFHVNAQAAGESCLGYLLENNVLLAVLRRACLADASLVCLDGYRLERAVPLSDDRSLFEVLCVSDARDADADADADVDTDAKAEARTVRARLVVGAEGRQSRLRDLLGFPVSRRAYDQSALVCQVQTKYPHDWTAWQDFHESGPLAFLPLSARAVVDPAQEAGWPVAGVSEQYCSIVWSLPSVEATALVGAGASETLKERLNAVTPAALGGVEQCSVAHAFPLSGHLADQMQQRGAVILGDAAHGYHPMAGQGLNVGLLDVAVLVDQLVNNDARFGDFSHESGLRRFERKRRFQQRTLFELTSGLHRLYSHSAWWLRLGRNVGMRLFDEISPLKKMLVQRANAHRIDLPERFRPTAEVLPF